MVVERFFGSKARLQVGEESGRKDKLAVGLLLMLEST